jgi:alpha-beta hydrolase superfamily lysophospholipase
MLLRKLSLFLMVIVVLAGCTPLVQKPGELHRTSVLTDKAFETIDGKSLPVKKWSAGEDATAVIVAVHGFNDYRNGFAFPASWWMTQGITTYAYDQRGFGETDQTGIWAGKEQMITDLISLSQLVKQKHPNKPVYLLGESMGGAVVMGAAIDQRLEGVDGIILSAPAVWGWQSLNPFYRMTLWLGAHLFPDQKPTGRSLGIQASDNISMLRNLGRDPLFIKKTRIDSVYGLVGLMDYAYDSADKQKLPLLILYGANDEVIPKSPVENVVSRLPEQSDIVLYKDGWHLLMRDLQAPVVWSDIKSWIEKRDIPSGNRVTNLPLFPGG